MPAPTIPVASERRSGAHTSGRRWKPYGVSASNSALWASPLLTPMLTFASALVALARARVEFLVVGGLAVARAGYVRVTDDVDLLVEASSDNIERLIAVLSTFGAGAAAELTPADFPIEEGCVRVAEDFDIDLFTLMSGRVYADLLPLAVEHEVDGEAVRFLGVEGLIRLKAPSLRPKDRLDVEMLRRLGDPDG